VDYDQIESSHIALTGLPAYRMPP